jgi:replicative DNA helicase
LQVSEIIIKSLIDNDDYMRRVTPFLKQEYFVSKGEQTIFKHIKDYVENYNNPPTVEALMIEMSNDNTIMEDTFSDIDSVMNSVKEDIKAPEIEWLLTTTEKFCKDRALELALHESILIYEGKSKDKAKGAIPDILSNALAVGFDTTIGHDYFENADDRYEYYNRKEEKISTGIAYLDKVTNGGFSKKTLNLLLAGTNVGKSLAMCNMAANNLMDGKNVLYISAEMKEEEISKRIDANVLDIEIKNLQTISKSYFDDRIARAKKKTHGRLIVKEYPTSSASVTHIRSLLNELLLKKHFVPDIIYVDYLNILISTRFKAGQISNTNTYYKAISEELRGLGVEMNVPIVSASQFNRGGHANSNPDIDDTSEAFGINFTADFVAALISTEELAKQNLLLIKQLKSRYDHKNNIPMFFVGVDIPKMRYYDLDDPLQGIQEAITPSTSKTANTAAPNKLSQQQSKFHNLNFS